MANGGLCRFDIPRLPAISRVDQQRLMFRCDVQRRGAHQRTDFTTRDDERFLNHALVYRDSDGSARIERLPVTITRWPPGERVYGR